MTNMDNQMFCFQCQETAKGTGCTLRGVCGKLPQTSAYMDLLLSVTRGVGSIMHVLHRHGVETCNHPADFLTDALFSTITNANFDDESLKEKIRNGLTFKAKLTNKAVAGNVALPSFEEVTWVPASEDQWLAEAAKMGVLRNQNEDIRSLKETITLGVKGMAAYYEHAANLGYRDEEIIDFIAEALYNTCRDDISVDELIALTLKTGDYSVKAMALLDKANTGIFGNPEISHVKLGVSNRPGILISGHDLHDLKQLLEQTQGQGIDVYTHGEMLSAHYYPELKKYSNLVGNYGNAWWKQKEEFATFNGPIVFTTNCIVPPTADANYKNRVFTTNSTGFPGWKHIQADENGHKDFSEVIAMAKTCQPPTEIEQGEIVGGFAHNQVFALADKIVDAIKAGKIRRFYVMGGCDGRMPSRNYYTEYAKALPKDTIILTSGCAKYKYIKLNLGDIDGIPRVLDAGQCNDSYSWAVVALKLKEIFALNDINELPITFNIGWYEQKAVTVLLGLLSLGVNNIHIGPTLPGFLSAGVRDVLISKFGLGTISTVEEDIKASLKA